MSRLRRMLEEHGQTRNAREAELLDEELARATEVDPEQMPPDVVTMNSRVVFEAEGSGRRREVVLVYPEEADPAADKISVLAPVGAALLGLSVGQTIDWPMPGGRRAQLRIVEVLYQPEASGHFDL